MKRCAIKFCGLKSKDALSYAVDLGVDYLGFVVDYPKSPRSNTLKEFLSKAKWLRENKKGKYKIVAVTVDMSLKNMQSIIDSGLADVIQLHGNENADTIKKIKGVEVWKAWNNKSKENVLELAKYADKILLDSGNAKEKAENTSGEFDAFDLYKKLKAKGMDVVLSGGIDCKNVSSYVDKLKPQIIDVSRGIEAGVGRKSKVKMKEFMKKVNDYYKS
jgi:phosphoribosylanthranilate isomerase